ncbi:MAG: FAD-dependent oxidoreductase, partial [Candidatus Omnitrophota bacterium]
AEERVGSLVLDFDDEVELQNADTQEIPVDNIVSVLKETEKPDFAILITGYNEAEALKRNLQLWEELGYLKRVIYVDDGSTDNSLEILEPWKEKGLRVFANPNNAKKIGSIREAVNQMYDELPPFLFLSDADSFIRGRDGHTVEAGLIQAIEYLKSKNWSAMGMRVDPYTDNPKAENLVTLQRIEYKAARFWRKLMSKHNRNICIPGAAGLYRTDSLRAAMELCHLDHDPDDVETTWATMVLHLIKHPDGRNGVGYSGDFLEVVTEPPTNLRALYYQRLTWNRGMLKVHMYQNRFLISQFLDTKKSWIMSALLVWEFFEILSSFALLLLPFMFAAGKINILAVTLIAVLQPIFYHLLINVWLNKEITSEEKRFLFTHLYLLPPYMFFNFTLVLLGGVDVIKRWWKKNRTFGYPPLLSTIPTGPFKKEAPRLPDLSPRPRVLPAEGRKIARVKLPAAGDKKVSIIGAGLSGLSSAYYLSTAGADIQVYERANEPGGLVGTKMAHDSTGREYNVETTLHLLHTRPQKGQDMVKEIMHELVGAWDPVSDEGNLMMLEQRQNTFMMGRLVGHPVQYHLRDLPPETRNRLYDAFLQRPEPNPERDTLLTRARSYFGDGIVSMEKTPYFRKWLGIGTIHKGLTLDDIAPGWLFGSFENRPGEELVKKGLSAKAEDVNEYRARFLYPRAEGTIALPNAFARQIDPEAMHYGTSVVSVDPENRKIILSDGTTEIEQDYDYLISSMPLPELIKCIKDVPEDIAVLASQLKWVAQAVVNVSVGPRRRIAGDPQFIYFSEEKYPFTRITIQENLSSDMVPKDRSLLCAEVTIDPHSPLDENVVAEQVIKGMKEAGMVDERDAVEVVSVGKIPYAYVIHDHAHKEATAKIHEYLQGQGIFSVGRYGKWTYDSISDAILTGPEMVNQLTFPENVEALRETLEGFWRSPLEQLGPDIWRNADDLPVTHGAESETWDVGETLEIVFERLQNEVEETGRPWTEILMRMLAPRSATDLKLMPNSALSAI